MVTYILIEVIVDALHRIEEKILNACNQAGRMRKEIRLMAVSKFQSAERIQEAIQAGIQLFGESRVQETKDKRFAFPPDVELHFIGHLQGNKAEDAAALYHAVQSLDSIKTAERLSHAAEKMNKSISVYIEVNSSGEPSKFGVRGYPALLALTQEMQYKKGLSLQGVNDTCSLYS